MSTKPATVKSAPTSPGAAPDPQFRSPPKMPGHMPGMHGRPQIVPRAMAAKEDFVEGDYVVYPTHGVGKVERIATEEIAGHRLELIHITFEENRMTLRVPVAKARTAGLRKLATRAVFDKALALMKGRARIKRTMWSRRAQEYEAKINSGDPIAIAEVVRDLHRNAGQLDQSFSERQIYEAAMDRLATEMAALDQSDKATAVTKLADYLKSIVKSGSAADAIEGRADGTLQMRVGPGAGVAENAGAGLPGHDGKPAVGVARRHEQDGEAGQEPNQRLRPWRFDTRPRHSRPPARGPRPRRQAGWCRLRPRCR